jgi:hypothetical protein
LVSVLTKTSTTVKTCRICGISKPLSDFTIRVASYDGYKNECRLCCNKQNRIIEQRKGRIPYYKNPSCSWYLGVHLAETLLLTNFKSAIRMPANNRGYDFLCGKGFKVDVKSSRRLYQYGRFPHWCFTIDKNQIADYFACIAFTDTECPTPLHYWLIPSFKVKHLVGLSIQEKSMQKWDEYKKPLVISH